MREEKHTYAFFLDVQKAFDIVWHDGLWFKVWELGIRGRMWRVIKNMYDITLLLFYWREKYLSNSI